jgi:hypothetical protein
MKNAIARYTIASITTKDIELVKRRQNIKEKGFTDESIYRRGIDEIEQDSVSDLSQNNNA